MTEATKRATKKSGPAVAGLAASFKDAPRLSEPKQARARVEAWLRDIVRTAAGRALKSLLGSGKGKLADIVAAIAEASPYLWDLIRADPARFLKLVEADPEAHFAMVIARTSAAADAAN